mgnify:CR=1 FL=1
MESTFYPYLGALGWTGLFLLIGTIIRAKVKFFQTFLSPASLIGGIIGFFVLNAGWLGIPSSTGWKTITPVTFSTITFHLFAFGFVGIGLLQAKSGTSGKVVARGALWIALIFGLLFSVQAMVGKGTFDVWKLLFGGDFFTGNGYLLGAGFTQGPGQTQAYASIWETTYKISNSLNVGLAFAAVGFLVAGLVGVPLAFYGIKRGWCTGGRSGELPQNFLRGLMDRGDNPPCSHSTTHPANIDNLGFHVGLMAAIYGVAYLFGLLFSKYMPAGIAGLGFGLTFCWGMFLAMLLRKFMGKIDILHLIDGETTRRLVGGSVDFMICAVFLGIEMRALQEVLLPFIVAIAAATFITLIICVWFGRRSPEYGFERCLIMFGYATGTAASGLLLLRIADPDYETPVAVEGGLMNVFSCLTFLPVTLSMPFAPLPGYPIVWVFAAVIIATPIAMYLLKFIRKPAF